MSGGHRRILVVEDDPETAGQLVEELTISGYDVDLARNEGRVLSRASMLKDVWDLHFDPSTNIIYVYVARGRRKVDDAQAYPLIHTIRGIGYCRRPPG